MSQARFKPQVLQVWLGDFRFVPWEVSDSCWLETRHQGEKEGMSHLVTPSAPTCAMSTCKAVMTPLEAPRGTSDLEGQQVATL